MQPDEIQIDGQRNVLIAGPTAAGKSALALRLAEEHGGTVVNGDALQVYDCWRVLTARPDPEEEARAPHALYGHVACDAGYSVGDWLRDVATLSSDGPLIVVGGTGLYFRALSEGLADIPPIPHDIRAMADCMSPEAMIADLDAVTAERIDLANPRRVQRAWEVQRASGKGLAQWHDETPPPLMPLDKVDAFVLNADPETLSDRIARRFHAMIKAGALDEARAALPDWDPARQSAQAIGAPELIDHLLGKTTLDEAVNLAIIATRQYAKRQRTWFRARMTGWQQVAV